MNFVRILFATVRKSCFALVKVIMRFISIFVGIIVCVLQYNLFFEYVRALTSARPEQKLGQQGSRLLSVQVGSLLLNEERL